MDGVGDNIAIDLTTTVPVTDVKLLAKSGTDTTVPTSLGSGTIVANDTWQEVAFETPAKEYGEKLWLDAASYIDAPNFIPASSDFSRTIVFYAYTGCPLRIKHFWS